MKQNRIRWKQSVAVSPPWLLLGVAIGLGGPLGAVEGGKVFQAGALAMDVAPTNFPVSINGGLGLLQGVSPKPRLRTVETDGPYAQAILASKPVGRSCSIPPCARRT